jgi:hypothetical protein
MHLALHRIHRTGDATIGEMYLDGTFFCYTLEDVVRDLGPNGEGKVWGQTAIPAGTYAVALTLSPRFGKIMPRLLNVPFFTGILIHKGNSPKDTHGCILVGDVRGEDTILQSTAAYERLFPKLAGAVERDEDITITITNNF